jgi:putative hemin transport protein
MDTLTAVDPILELQQRHQALVAGEPRLRIRDRAARLGVTEAELVAAECGLKSIPLATPNLAAVQAVFRELGTLGKVMALSRNEWCVHERHGRYEDIQADSPVGIVLGPDIDLRMFFQSWRYCYAVDENERRSLQFFDASGNAVHKVYMTDASNAEAYDAIVARFAAPHLPLPVIEAVPAPAEKPVPDDAGALRTAWLAMTDTHDFFAMLRKFAVSRVGALRAAGTDLAQPVGTDTVENMLQQAAASGLSIMCFVGNRGIVQIHTGPVQNLQRTGPWYNVLDPQFNLHLNTAAIASSWIVNKPTVDGWVTSLELFAEDGSMIVQFFGARKPGKPELREWRTLLSCMCPEPLKG